MVDDIRAKVLKAIETGKVTRRSSLYFFGRVAVTFLATAFILIIALYLVSLAVFVSAHEMVSPPPRGFGRIVDSLISLPWFIIFLILVLVGVLEWLNREFSFLYQRPVIYTFFLGVAMVVSLGSLMVQSEMHERAFKLSKERKLPVMGPVYRYYLHVDEEIDELLDKKKKKGGLRDD